MVDQTKPALMTEHRRTPTNSQQLALDVAVRLAPETVGPAWVLHQFDGDATLISTSAIVDRVLPEELVESPLWAIVQRVTQGDTYELLIRVGGPDAVFTFHVKGGARTLESVEPSPYRRSPTTVDVKRALAVSAAVFRAGGMLRLNELTGKWTSFLGEVGDTTPIARAFGSICYPACKLKEYSAACLTEKGFALIEVGRKDHVFAFTRKASEADLVWHGVILRAKRPSKPGKNSPGSVSRSG